jgi:hypothetical protein
MKFPPKMKLLTFQDSWPWALINLTILAILLLACIKGQGEAKTIKLLILGLSVFGFQAITLIKYIWRYRAVSVWNKAYKTKQGAAVINKVSLGIKILKEIDDNISQACRFWNQYKNPSEAQLLKIEKAFYGATITITNKPIKVMYLGNVLGVQIGQSVEVVFDNDKIKTPSSYSIHLT